ncbi:MAG: V-type ATP synthase subunit D [Chromatiaceae bacterium]|nr:MAG: V-type ATP synthase subunit D [Chromatiaceae bacterium]
MSRVALSKSSLAKQNRALATYERYLPSLDLKRKQLVAERAKALAMQEATRREMEALRAQVQEQLPMLANQDIALADLVQVRGVQVAEENLLGTRVPVLTRLDIAVGDYGYLSTPHWVDNLVTALKRMLELEAHLALQQRRKTLLDEAVRKVTQRVNLFDKVLIPRARQNIRRIKVYLADAERAGIVRSKIAKNKRLREALA